MKKAHARFGMLCGVYETDSAGLDIEIINVASVYPLEREFYPDAEKIKKAIFSLL